MLTYFWEIKSVLWKNNYWIAGYPSETFSFM